METSTCTIPEQKSSVEISQNAKGEARVTVKVYDIDPVHAAEMAAKLYAKTIDDISSRGL